MSSPAEMFLKHVANVIAERGTQYGDVTGNMAAIAVRWSVPGARPRPRSMRPEYIAASVPNCSAITSGE